MSSENFNWINTFLFPYFLGVIPGETQVMDNYFVVTNNALTHRRLLGSRQWTKSTGYNIRLATATDLEESLNIQGSRLMEAVTESEHIKNPTACFEIKQACQGFWLATWGDLQMQYHYCLTLVDPLLIENSEQELQFLFPGSIEDLWSQLPESQTSIPSPMLAGSLGRLADLKLDETLRGIAEAKKRLLTR